MQSAPVRIQQPCKSQSEEAHAASAIGSVPTGHLKIAQRFIAGFAGDKIDKSPNGTTEEATPRTSAVLSGLDFTSSSFPGSELPGYCRMSLQDNNCRDT
jgi:hypothetical protein